jgi:hypothetical protein
LNTAGLPTGGLAAGPAGGLNTAGLQTGNNNNATQFPLGPGAGDGTKATTFDPTKLPAAGFGTDGAPIGAAAGGKGSGKGENEYDIASGLFDNFGGDSEKMGQEINKMNELFTAGTFDTLD